MKLTCKLFRSPIGQWVAQHDSREVGHVEVQAPRREDALEKIRGEIRYRLELCPCTGDTYRHIQIEVVDA